jgi:hypothetical protein
MPNITNNGRKLAIKLAPAVGVSHDVLELCSLIARNAKTYDRLQVDACNGPWFVQVPNAHMPRDEYRQRLERWESDLAKRDERCAARLTALVDQLAKVSGVAIKPVLGGDPRGVVVKLALPPEFERLHDDWSREGVCVEF